MGGGRREEGGSKQGRKWERERGREGGRERRREEGRKGSTYLGRVEEGGKEGRMERKTEGGESSTSYFDASCVLQCRVYIYLIEYWSGREYIEHPTQ